MVHGMAGIFGGNERSTAVSGMATHGVKRMQPVEPSTFSPLLGEVLQKTGIGQGATGSGLSSTGLKKLQQIAPSTFSPFLGDSLQKLYTPSKTDGASVKTASADGTNTSLTLVNGLPPVTVPTTAPTETTTTPTPPVTSTTPASGTTPAPVVNTAVAALEAALTQAGVDISQLQFNEHQDTVGFPGGNYINDEITVQYGNQTAEYGTGLVAASPQTTVVEIQEMMAGIQIGAINPNNHG
jgi:hypothetical protein